MRENRLHEKISLIKLHIDYNVVIVGGAGNSLHRSGAMFY